MHLFYLYKVFLFYNTMFFHNFCTKFQFLLIQFLFAHYSLVHSQLICSNFTDIFKDRNNHPPEFEIVSFTTPIIRCCDQTFVPNLISFGVVDKDDMSMTSLVSQFNVTSNDTNFHVTRDINNNKFIFNFKG